MKHTDFRIMNILSDYELYAIQNLTRSGMGILRGFMGSSLPK